MPAPAARPMKARKAQRAMIGIALCTLGILLELSMPRDVRHTLRVEAGGCRLVTDIVAPEGGGTPQGFVVLLHGLAANKRTMLYVTQGLASQGLRVFVPDLPGHGRTEEPFSFDRAAECSNNLLRELISRGLLDAGRTILAGHSMGGAIALQVASDLPVAGVVALSPAPMRDVPGIPREAVPYHGFGKLPARSLVINGRWEPKIISRAASELFSSSGDATSRYVLVPRVTHVSMLFDPRVMIEAQTWAASLLHIQRKHTMPSHRGLLGLFVGLAGIITLVGPFLREILQGKNQEGPLADMRLVGISKRLTFVEFTIAAMIAVGILHYVSPLRFFRLFEGDYFASVLLIAGVAVLALHINSLRHGYAAGAAGSAPARPRYISILIAAFAAVLLAVLFGAWFDLSFTEVWPTAARLARAVPFFIAVLPYHFAEEFLLGPASQEKEWKRLLMALVIRLLIWLVLVGGIFFLHSGEILPVLLAPYFALVCLGQRWAMDVVRRVTGLASAAAIFGAILLTGFCLVVFPTT